MGATFSPLNSRRFLPNPTKPVVQLPGSALWRHLLDTQENGIIMKRFGLAALAAAVMLSLVGGTTLAQKPSGDKEPRKPQASVAAKDKAFATVAADDAAVKNALKADDLTTAKKHIDKTATFTGTVVKVFAPSSNSVVLLNFAKNYREAVSGVVYARSFAKFPDLSKLEGKKVLVTGKVIDFHDQTEVELADAAAIKIIK
jgi:hypothetical protein